MYALSEFCYPHVEQDESFVFQDSFYGVPFHNPETGKPIGPQKIREMIKAANLAKLPHVLSRELSACSGEQDQYLNCSGWDRLVHCIQHLFIRYLYAYATINHLPDALRMPQALTDLINIGGEVRENGKRLTSIITVVWEILETGLQALDIVFKDIDKANLVKTGYFDSNHPLDKIANYAGGAAGEQLAIGPQSWDRVRQITSDLQAKLQDLPSGFKPQSSLDSSHTHEILPAQNIRPLAPAVVVV